MPNNNTFTENVQVPQDQINEPINEQTQAQEDIQPQEIIENPTSEEITNSEVSSETLQMLSSININIQETNFYFFVLLVTIFVLLIWKLVWKTFMVLIEKF